MIIQVEAHAVWWVRATATAALVLHVGGGCAGLMSGGVSMFARKGGQLHRTAGRVFVLSMLTMAAMAAVTAPFLRQWGNVIGGAFTFYLVLTGWQTLRRPAGRAGWLEAGTGLIAFAIAVGAWWIGWLGDHRPVGMPGGQPTQSAYGLAVVALLAAGLDWRVARRGGLSGTQRLMRHLWRMCVAVFIAAGSFFLGQQQVFPEYVQGSPFLMVPVLAPLALMAVWQTKARFSKTLKGIRTTQPIGAPLPSR